MNNHSALVNKVLLEIGMKYPHVRAWKSATGEAFTIDSVKRSVQDLLDEKITIWQFLPSLARISFGKVGQADISGIIAPNGRALYIEVKTGTGRLSKEQKAFRDMVISRGCVHIECRDLKDLEILKTS